jgi:hypothetical protein
VLCANAISLIMLHIGARGGLPPQMRWEVGMLARLGVQELVLTGILLPVLSVVALCWVLWEPTRSQRLTQILAAWRGTRPQALGQRAGKARRRRAAAGSGCQAAELRGPGDTAGYHLLAREFSLTEGAARGTRGHLGPGGRDQRGFVAVIMMLELGQAWDPGGDDGL